MSYGAGMGSPPIPTEAAVRMIRLYQAGRPIRAVAAAVGYSYGGVRNILIRAGVELRRRGRHRRYPER